MELHRTAWSSADFEAQLDELTACSAEHSVEIERVVRDIIDAVRTSGDEAVLEYTRRYDGHRPEAACDLRIAPRVLDNALRTIDADLRNALNIAAQRIRDYAERQCLVSYMAPETEGVVLGQQITPLDSVGLYVPGGAASYPSSVLMNAIPARVAGVSRVVAVVPAPQGRLNPAVLAALALCEADEVWMIGGAQAIAALAYGTEQISAVSKIVGPGNRYVAEAKRQVFGRVGIDMIAGPSEVLVVSDGSGDPAWIAADMIAQAEHDVAARAILVCSSEGFIDRVIKEICCLTEKQPRRKTIEQSLEQNARFILVPDLNRAVEVANHIAPEHLELVVDKPEAWLPEVRNAGAVFLGAYASEVLGDYCVGSNHVLPTGGAARFASPLGVYDFQKRTSVVGCTAEAATTLGKIAERIAIAEGLHAHAAAARCRMPS